MHRRSALYKLAILPRVINRVRHKPLKLRVRESAIENANLFTLIGPRLARSPEAHHKFEAEARTQ